MSLSVMSSNGGNSQGHLFKPARPVKTATEPSSAGSGEQKAAGQARAASASAIDSTGIGTAHIAAALTVYMSTLATPSRATVGSNTPEGSATTTQSDRALSRASAARTTAGSGAADLLRVLDAYAS